MKNVITFSKEAISGGTGWFEFDPEEHYAWSFEETVARIYSLCQDQDVFGSQEKSSFDAHGFLDQGLGTKSRFIVCDWREDKHFHVLFADGEKPKRLTKLEFIVALEYALEKTTPREFRSTYVYSDDVFSWPPTPSKGEAVKMAKDALNACLETFRLNDWTAEQKNPKRIVDDAKAAMKALEEAFE